jgi:phenylacetate-CoA ligase
MPRTGMTIPPAPSARPEFRESPPSIWATAWDIRLAQRGGPASVMSRQRTRLAGMIGFARRNSPFYRRRYGHLPDDTPDILSLPPVTKQELMEHFRDWVTDPEVTREGVEHFVSDPDRIGTSFLDRYVVFATSGTTGRPAPFVHDRGSVAVSLALAVVRRFLPLLSPLALWSFLRLAGRTATIIATGGHFTSSVIDGLARQRFPRLSKRNRTFSLLLPLPELVRKINDFRPAILGSYPTALALLAQERESGALRIDPVLALTGAEWLSPAVRDRMAAAFGCPVRDTYAASEFLGIAFDCGHGRLHLNADWVVLEPVDAEYRPVPAGQPSFTALLTNLANRVQPILRYDIGDSVTGIPGPCPCGSPLPGIQVEGRRDEVLHLRTKTGGTVAILPMALSTVVEETPGVRSYQLVQAGPARIRLRVEEVPGHDRNRVCEDLAGRLRAFLSAQGAAPVEVERTEERPVRDGAGGKLRQIIADPASRTPSGNTKE